MGDVTRWLEDWQRGDPTALPELMEAIYGELRRLAAGYLRRERRGHSLDTTDLVHEAYLRLVDQRRVEWRSRAHFLAIAARLMRRILVNHARDRRRQKRGGGAPHLPLDELAVLPIGRPAEWLEVDRALRALEGVDEQQARAVELRYFGGLNRDEIAEVLGVSRATVARRLRVARAWLYRQLHGEALGESRAG